MTPTCSMVLSTFALTSFFALATASVTDPEAAVDPLLGAVERDDDRLEAAEDRLAALYERIAQIRSGQADDTQDKQAIMSTLERAYQAQRDDVARSQYAAAVDLLGGAVADDDGAARWDELRNTLNEHAADIASLIEAANEARAKGDAEKAAAMVNRAESIAHIVRQARQIDPGLLGRVANVRDALDGNEVEFLHGYLERVQEAHPLIAETVNGQLAEVLRAHPEHVQLFHDHLNTVAEAHPEYVQLWHEHLDHAMDAHPHVADFWREHVKDAAALDPEHLHLWLDRARALDPESDLWANIAVDPGAAADEGGVPFLSDLPLLNNLFEAHDPRELEDVANHQADLLRAIEYNRAAGDLAEANRLLGRLDRTAQVDAGHTAYLEARDAAAAALDRRARVYDRLDNQYTPRVADDDGIAGLIAEVRALREEVRALREVIAGRR